MNGFALGIFFFVLSGLYQLFSNVTKISGNSLMEKRLALAPVFRRSQFCPSWQRRHGSWSVLVCAGGRVYCSSSLPYEPGSRHSRPEDEKVGGYKLQGLPLVTYSHQLSCVHSHPKQHYQPETKLKLKCITGPQPLKRCQYHCMRVSFLLRLVISMPFSFRHMLTEMPRNDVLPTV